LANTILERRKKAMPIRGKKQRFTDGNIDKAPNKAGVYVLSQYRETIYIGKSDIGNSVKSRLRSAKKGSTPGCKGATSFQVECCKGPSKREKQLLEQYKKQHGRLPRMNDRIG
jgi:hypothetical protein